MPYFKISLIHPSRSRALKSFQCLTRWVERAGVPLEILVSIDRDDPEKELYFSNVAMLPISEGSTKQVLCNYNRSAVDAINKAAGESTGEILIVVSDDFDCPENWGVSLLNEVRGKSDWILKTLDGIQEWIITLPIMDRIYYRRFGYVYHPDYQHLFSDTELTCVADLLGRKLISSLIFTHRHYSVVHPATPDAISKRANATWNQGEQLFIDRYKKKFGLTDIRGRITNQNYQSWISQKLRGVRDPFL